MGADRPARMPASKSWTATTPVFSAILEARRGDLKFEDVVRGMGAETAFAAFESELADLEGKISELVVKVDGLERQLEKLTSKKRSTEILSIFRRAYAAALVSLNMSVIDTKRLRLNSRPRIPAAADLGPSWHTIRPFGKRL